MSRKLDSLCIWVFQWSLILDFNIRIIVGMILVYNLYNQPLIVFYV